MIYAHLDVSNDFYMGKSNMENDTNYSEKSYI